MRTRREDVKVEIDGIVPFCNEKYAGIKLLWSGNIGFGEYEIYSTDSDKVCTIEQVPEEEREPEDYMYTNWKGQSEYMDSNDDKWFIKLLMNSLIEKMVVEK